MLYSKSGPATLRVFFALLGPLLSLLKVSQVTTLSPTYSLPTQKNKFVQYGCSLTERPSIQHPCISQEIQEMARFYPVVSSKKGVPEPNSKNGKEIDVDKKPMKDPHHSLPLG